MLRVGLTGNLGSGKTTVAAMLAARGATVFSSDEMGRAMMQPGQPVYAAIVAHFGDGVLGEDGALNRRELARLAFEDGRVEELNAIVHPAVISEQARLIAELSEREPRAIAVVESALLFSTRHAGGEDAWSKRFDEIVLVTAPEAVAIARFVKRAGADEAQKAAVEAEARKRLAAQRESKPDFDECIIIRNNGDLATLESRVSEVWRALERMASR